MGFFLVLFSSILASAAPKGQLVSTTVGRVQNHVVTSREVQINHLVEGSLYNKKSKSLETLSPRGRAFLREVTAVLLEWTVHLEAKSLSAATISAAELKKAEQTVLKRATKVAQWKSLGVRQSELKQLIRRKLQAKKFIRFKVDSASVPITDAEAQEYFENNRLQFGSLPFENFKANIKGYLGQKQVDQRLKDWFEVLRGNIEQETFSPNFNQEIRELRSDDLGALWSLTQELQASSLGAKWNAESLALELDQGEGLLLGQNGELAAFLLYRPNNGIFEVTWLGVALRFRGLGLMKALFLQLRGVYGPQMRYG